MNAILLDAAKALPLSEGIERAEALWEKITEAGYEPPLPAARAPELDRRVEEHRGNPEAAVPWNRVRAELARNHTPRG